MKEFFAAIDLALESDPDGGVIASSDVLPILVVARDLDALRAKLQTVKASLEKFLASMPPAEAHAFLKGRGVQFFPANGLRTMTVVVAEDLPDGRATIPVMLGAPH